MMSQLDNKQHGLQAMQTITIEILIDISKGKAKNIVYVLEVAC